MKTISIILQELLVRNDLPAWWNKRIETEPEVIKKKMIDVGATDEKGFKKIISKIKTRKRQLKKNA